MPSPVDRVEIEGLRAFGRELRRAGGELPKELKRENRAILAPVVGDAQRRWHMTPRSPARPPGAPTTLQVGRGKAIKSIRPLVSVSAAKIAIGRPSLPYVLGQEFGSFGGLHKFQFPPRSDQLGAGSAGWFLYPAVRAAIPKLKDQYLAAIDRVSRRAFPGRFGRVGGTRGG